MSNHLEPGAVLAGRYELERSLGEGGMGVVWLARHTTTKKRVALKLVKESGASQHAKRLVREARAAGVIRHPNVVEIFDVIEQSGGSPVIVMEYLEGRPLSALLAEAPKLSIERAASIMVPVISAVGTAHTHGIVHRDLKPDNIFLVERPSADVKVVDFGIAKLTAEEGDAAQTSALTSTGAIMGTPHYMAPEQVFGERKLDHRVDVWALGLILYRMLSGVLPTDAENVGQTMKIIVSTKIAPLASVAPDVPEDVAKLVDRMLQRAARQRLDGLAEALDVLGRYTTVRAPGFDRPPRSADETGVEGARTMTEGGTDAPLSVSQRDRTPTRPRPTRWVGVGALGLAGAIAAIAWASSNGARNAMSSGATEASPPEPEVASTTAPSVTSAAAPLPSSAGAIALTPKSEPAEAVATATASSSARGTSALPRTWRAASSGAPVAAPSPDEPVPAVTVNQKF